MKDEGGFGLTGFQQRIRARTGWGTLGALLVTLAALVGSCSPSDGPRTGSQTNWYRLCTSDTECGELDCICGTCTRSCEDSCGDLPHAACVGADQAQTLALCAGEPSESSICLGNCEDIDCPSGSYCSDGLCLPDSVELVVAKVDTTTRYQTLRGFGCSLAYGEDAMVTHPRKSELFDAMFRDSGLDVLRLRDRFEADREDELSVSGEIVDAARARMSEAPLLLLTSGSPPADLKENGMRFCAGNPETCTLVRDMSGEFDYAGFATHWRDAIEAYAGAGIEVDYLSIQNNPNWVPAASEPNEACRFLPREGSTMVEGEDGPISVEYPGYQEALEAVESALADLTSSPLLLGPETTGLAEVGDYEESLASGSLAALACHLYEEDSASTSEARFSAVHDLAEEMGLPVFVTEMRSDGLETAMLVHRAVTEAMAEMYLQNDFVALTETLGGNPTALIELTSESFDLQEPYYALAHFARDTAPGWNRVGIELDEDEVLATAWVAPDEQALTVVLLNPGTNSEQVQIVFEEDYADSTVTLTTFGGDQQGERLGELASSGLLDVPPRSIVTVALRN